MDLRTILLIFSVVYLILLTIVFTAPVDPNKKSDENLDKNNVEKKIESEIDDLGLEYGRYLQQVVEALEQDKEFAKKLENITQDEIKNGAIAKELNFVSHSVRTKLDELKRIELDRLRKLAKKEHQLEEGMTDESGRQWRTLNNKNLDNSLLTDSQNAYHLDHQNPHSFEAEDLQKLILSASKDLEELDQKRREDFKQYEMEKELQYRESLNNMTEDQRKETIKKHDELEQKHREHPRVHHPGSKKQLEQVWEEQDHMPKEEFNPKVFFTMHDINGDGFLDPQEVEALLILEIKKVYSDKNPEDDPNEMQEEYHRMREHIYKEADTNHDGLISKKEFLDFTHRMEFEKDDGWKGVDETKQYNEEDLKQYQLHRQQLQQQYGQYGAYQQQYVPQYYPEGYHPPQQYYAHPGQHQQQQQMHPNEAQYYVPVPQHPNQQLLQQQGIHPQMNQQLSHEQQQALYHQQQQQQGIHPQMNQQLSHEQQQALYHQQQQQQGIHPQMNQQLSHEQQQALYHHQQQQQQQQHQQQLHQQQQQQHQQIPQQLHQNIQQTGHEMPQQPQIGLQQQQQPIHPNVGQQMPPNSAFPSNQAIPSQQQMNANQQKPNIVSHSK